MENTNDKSAVIIKIDSSKILENCFKLVAKLGEGTFGIVVSAVDKRDNTMWALKKIVKSRCKKGSKKSWENEFHILSKIKHPNIVKLKEMYETNHYAYLILEYCDGYNLAKQLDKCGKFTDLESSYFIYQVAAALSYLHQKQIVHRDIKLENIFLRKKTAIPTNSVNILPNSMIFEVKLGDFGLAVELKRYEKRLIEFCGTPMYMAPEIIRGKSYSRQCDVWSIGIMMFMMITGTAPFISKREALLFKEIVHINLDKLCQNHPIDKLAKQCLSRLLHLDPAYRYSVQELILDEWINKGYQLVLESNNDDKKTLVNDCKTNELSLLSTVNCENSAKRTSYTNVLELMREFNRCNITSTTTTSKTTF